MARGTVLAPAVPVPSKWRAAIPMVLGLAYGISPIDLIPDLIPILGWSDDAAVLLTASLIAFKLLRQRRHAQKAATR